MYKNAKLELLFLLIVSVIVFFNRLDQATLVFDDCYYAQKAKEMVRMNNYLVPTYGNKLDVHDGKPILYYWVLMFFGKIFGFCNFSMRLGSAIFGLVGVIVIFLFAKKYFSSYVGFVAAIVLIFSQQYMRHSRMAQPDVIFSVFFTLAMISFYAAVVHSKRLYFYYMGLFAGLALMTRNLPGLFVFPVILAYIIVTKNFKVFNEIHFFCGILLSIIIFLPWHLWMTIKFGKDFLQGYFGKLLAVGLTGAGVYFTPWYAIIGTIFETYWPWLPFLIYGLYRETKNLFLGTYQKEEKLKIMFILLWAIIPFLIFQTAKFKGAQYIMPVYIPFAIIVARTIDSFKNKTRWLRGIIVVVLIVTLIYLIFPLSPKTLDIGHYGELSEIFEKIKQIDSDTVLTEAKHGYYFSNGIMFYTDKKVITKTIEEIKTDCISAQKYYFVLLKDEFLQLGRNVKIDIIAFTDKFIFFANNPKCL